jgi:hypothetical protein
LCWEGFWTHKPKLGGPNNNTNVALYTKTRQKSPPLNAAKALAET